MKKIYEKTRYDNIYRHSKNLNYVIRHNGTTISKIDDERIYDIKVAKDYKSKLELSIEKKQKHNNSYLFKDLWQKYLFYLENIKKVAFNTLKKKKSIYECYLKDLNSEKVPNITKDELSVYINNLITTDKQKNTVLVILKGFFNWCLYEEEIISRNPAKSIHEIKTVKTEMKYWSIKEFSKFIKFMENEKSDSAYRIKILTLLGLYLGDRIGESRALTWDCINEEHNTIKISHSINYDNKSNDFLSTTKTYSSDRIVDVSPKLIEELNKYKNYLIKKNITLKDLIFFNYNNNKPYTDTNLRKLFYKYCDAANVTKIRLYDLRHTYVALMMASGWELYHISKRIGHINYNTTVNKYGHLESKIRKEVATTTDKYL